MVICMAMGHINLRIFGFVPLPPETRIASEISFWVSNMEKLTQRQRQFVAEYLISLNATHSAVSAGYSAKTAKQQGSRLLTNVDVRQAIKAGREAAQKRAEVKLDDILREYKRIAFTGLSKFLHINAHGDPVIDLSRCTPEDLDLLSAGTVEDFTEGRGEGARNVRRIKIKLMDRLKALETLGKHLGLGEKGQGNQIDRLSLALMEISKRGSSMPISTSLSDQEQADNRAKLLEQTRLARIAHQID